MFVIKCMLNPPNELRLKTCYFTGPQPIKKHIILLVQIELTHSPALHSRQI